MEHLAQRMAMKTVEKDEAVEEEDSFMKASPTAAFELGPEGGAAGAVGVLGTPVSSRGRRWFEGPAAPLGLHVGRTGIHSGRYMVRELYVIREGLEG